MDDQKIHCFPTTKLGVRSWILGNSSSIGEPSASGVVYNACKHNNCKFVIKVINGDRDTQEDIKQEVTMQNKMADHNLALRVEDWWLCKNGKGGAIIMPILKETLGRYIQGQYISVKDVIAKIKMALILMQNLHKNGMYHGDSHINNIMLGYESNKLYFIDQGRSGTINKNNLYNLLYDYSYLATTIDSQMFIRSNLKPYFSDIRRVISNFYSNMETYISRYNTRGVSYYKILGDVTTEERRLLSKQVFSELDIISDNYVDDYIIRKPYGMPDAYIKPMTESMAARFKELSGVPKDIHSPSNSMEKMLEKLRLSFPTETSLEDRFRKLNELPSVPKGF